MKKVTSIVLNNFKNDSRVLKESITLQRAGYLIEVVALHEEPLQVSEIIKNIPVHRIRLKSRGWSKNRIIQLFKYIEFSVRFVREYKESEIFHCNDLGTLPIAVMIKKFFNPQAKIVYDAHEYETEINGLHGIRKFLIKQLEKRLISSVDKVITVSDSIAHEYVRLYGIEKPTLVLNTPSYFDVPRFDHFRKKFLIPEDVIVFLYQGALSHGRGILQLVEVFKSIDKKVVVVFMGYGTLEPLIKEASQRYDTIFFHEAVSPDVLLEYTGRADVGLSLIEDTCLSYRYCLPNKMFEYIMVGIPIIVSDLPEMGNVVQEYGVGVIAQNGELGLTQAIEEAILLSKQAKKESFDRVRREYNWENQEKRLLEVYDAL